MAKIQRNNEKACRGWKESIRKNKKTDTAQARLIARDGKKSEAEEEFSHLVCKNQFKLGRLNDLVKDGCYWLATWDPHNKASPNYQWAKETALKDELKYRRTPKFYENCLKWKNWIKDRNL